MKTALLLFALNALGPDPEAPQPLRFAWPEKLQAKVEVRIRGLRVVGREQFPYDARATFDLATRGDGDVRIIERSAFSGWKGKLPYRLGSAADRLVDRIPIVRVSSSGQFYGIERGNEAREAFAKELEIATLPPPMRRLFEMGTSEAGLTEMAKAHWIASIATWIGLVPGQRREGTAQTSIAHLGGSTLDLHTTLHWVGPAACDEDDAHKRCAELIAESIADPKQLEASVKRLYPGAGALAKIENRNTVKAVVEPRTMVLHRLHIGRTTAMPLPAPEHEVREETSRDYLFRYRAPP